MVGTCSTHGGSETHIMLVGKFQETTSLPTCRMEANSKINLRETYCEVVDWVRVTQGKVQWRAFVNTGMHLRLPYEQLISSPGE
jgi:hypothetical protein